MKLIRKPKTGECAPYTSMYIHLLPDDGRILDHLNNNDEAALTRKSICSGNNPAQGNALRTGQQRPFQATLFS